MDLLCFCSVLCLLCLCARLFICALWSPAGKGLTSWLSFVVSTVSLSLSHWYPVSGVVLDCIDSWSLHPYWLCYMRNFYFRASFCNLAGWFKHLLIITIKTHFYAIRTKWILYIMCFPFQGDVLELNYIEIDNSDKLSHKSQSTKCLKFRPIDIDLKKVFIESKRYPPPPSMRRKVFSFDNLRF